MHILRRDTTGGALLLLATVAALTWANSAWSESYSILGDFSIGPSTLHLHLSITQWAADGVLALFFFVVGLELAREFVAGDLRNPRTAAVPIAAAVGGVFVPACLYLAINIPAAEGVSTGWAVPAATDIAFAVAVLALVGSKLPPPVRLFLLTLAVVDDLIAVAIIALGYTQSISVLTLVGALIAAALFAFAYRRGFATGWILVPLALATWGLMHASGVHATIAGVLLGFCVPVRGGTSERLAHTLTPWSSCFAVPLFAFFAAGVHVGGASGLASAYGDPVALGIIVALVVGKPVGILATTWLMSRLPGFRLDDDLRWPDLVGVALLAGIGFTVSLLIADLGFGTGTLEGEHAKVGVLTGSLVAAVLGSVWLLVRSRNYRSRG